MPCLLKRSCLLAACLLLVSASASAQQLVFVTDISVGGDILTGGPIDGLSTGIERADAICVQEATAAGLRGAAEFKAWLSTSTMNAKDRIPQGPGPYVLPTLSNPTLVAADTAALLNADNVPLASAIDVRADGTAVSDRVWTGTAPDGTLLGDACNDWTPGPLPTGVSGLSGVTAGGWTETNAPLCNQSARLYCFGPPPPPPPPRAPGSSLPMLTVLATLLGGALSRRAATR